MELLQNSGFVALVLFIVNVIFNFGFYKAKLSQFPDKDEVMRLMRQQAQDFEKDIERKLSGHCPYEEALAELKVRANGFDLWIKEHEKFAASANEANHILLQELVLNTQNICDNLGIKYLKKNGNK